MKTFRRCKIMTVGEPGVGKSCLVKRYCEQRFVEEYVSTIGIDYGVKDWSVDLQTTDFSNTQAPEDSKNIKPLGDPTNVLKVNFWDVAGDPIYANVRSEFYTADVDALILVYDIRSRQSFEALPRWLAEFDSTIELLDGKKPLPRKWIVGNKTDLGSRQVSVEEAAKFAEKHGFKFVETSAQTGENIDFMFNSIFREIAAERHT